MKLFNLAVLVLAVLAMMMAGTSAEPKGVGNALKKGAKVIKGGLGALSALGAGHEAYEQYKNRG